VFVAIHRKTFAALLATLSVQASAAVFTPDLGPFSCVPPSPGPTIGTQVCGPNYVESHAKTLTASQAAEGGATTLTYFYEVVDPINRRIDVTLAFELFAQSVGDAFDVRGVGSHEADALISVGSADLTFVDSITAISDSGNPVATNGGNLQTTLLHVDTNTRYEIRMRTSAIADGVGEAIAFVDPSITVDPLLDPDAFVVVSDGILNVVTPSVITPIVPTAVDAALPEPASLPLLALGLVAVLGARRPRRTSRRPGGALAAPTVA
jgi:hypothetical protein